MTIQENIPLAPLTTLQVGGVARYFAELRREDEVQPAVQRALDSGLPAVLNCHVRFEPHPCLSEFIKMSSARVSSDPPTSDRSA